MQSVLIIIQLIVSVALVISVLLQRSEGGALGMGGGGSGFGGLFSPRGAADTLTRTTTVLGAMFFVTSLALTLVALHAAPRSSILDSAPVKAAPAQQQSPSQQKPSVPSVPTPH